MSGKTGNYILIGMVLGAILGALGGYFFGDTFIQIKFLGTVFLNALKMIVVPLIVASMIVGVTSLGDIRRLGRTAGKTLLYYLATTGFSVLIGIILVNLLQPGNGIGSIGNEIPEAVAQTKSTGFSDFVINLIPANLISAAAEGSVLPLIIFSLVFGGVLTAIGRKGKPVIDFFVGLNMAIMKIVILIIYFAPIGILALIGSIVAENRGSLQAIASGLGLYSLTVIMGLLIHALIILPLILKILGKKNPFRYFLNMGQALATAFTTASSAATLPITMESVTEKNKVNSKASSFVLPLGATINMDGTALYEAVAAIFIAQAINYPLSVEAQVIIFLTATLASIGAAAIPHAGLVTMVIVLSAVGLPLEGIGFIFAVDWFLDRCRTTVNVWGDSVGAAVIGETVEIRGYRIDGSKESRTTDKSKYKGTEQQGDIAAKGPRSNGKKRISRDRSTRGSRSQDGKRFQRKKDTSRKPRGRAPRSDDWSRGKKEFGPHYSKSSDKGGDDQSRFKRESSQIPQKTIESDLEKVHRQLESMGSGGVSSGEIRSRAIESKKDDFFDDGIPKFDFFGDKNIEKENVSDQPNSRSNSEDSMDKKSPSTDDESKPSSPDIPVISISETENEDKVEKEKPGADESDTGNKKSWGRARRKRPSR